MSKRDIFIYKFSFLLLAGFFLVSCMGTAKVEKPRLPDQPTEQMSTAIPTSIFLDDYADSDQFGDQYFARLPIEKAKDLSSEEIVRLMMNQWLEHYKMDCQDPYYQLEAYSVGNIKLDTARYGYEIVANIQYEILPVQPLTADYTGEVAPNGWYSFPGNFLPDGTEQLGAYFGVFREGDNYRLRMLIGWGG